ncbi:MAG: GTP 3',8-cyclase MoaA [Pseudomonadota bacterium]
MMAPTQAELGPGSAAVPARDLPPLVDRQNRKIDYLRVSVTDRCNYRCTYCLPEEGVPHAARADVLSFEEITRLVACFTRLGVRRVRLTGGEPTVRRDLPSLVEMLRRLPGIDDLALSTNGHLLVDLARPLRQAGVDRLNVSVDSLRPDRFDRITRGGDLARVLGGIEAARVAGFDDIKINAVAIRGFNDDELAALCDYAWRRGLVPRFIEQMPMAEGALFVPGAFMSAAEIRTAITAAHPGARLSAEPASAARGAGPARYFRLEGPDGERGRFGLITAMTEHFCDTCNRVRLSASGALHTCLAFDEVTDLRSVLHQAGDAAVVDTIRAAVAGKRDGHTFGLIGIGGPRKAMIQIGG